MVSVTLILSMIANFRNIGILIFYWNFISWRYNANEWTKRAVWTLRDKIGEWCHHRFAPKILGLGFEKIKLMIAGYHARNRAPAE